MQAALRFFPLLAALVSFLVPGGRRGDEAFSDAKVHLRSGDKWVRKSAVEKLAALGTPAAWELVLEALEDEKGEVADTAQWLLAKLPPGKLVGELLGRGGLGARDPWVRRRAAEVVARLEGPVEAERIVKALTDREPDVRWTGLWSLERLAGSPRLQGDLARRVLPAVARLAEREREPEVRARALFALAALDREGAVAPVEAGSADRKAAVRCAAVALAVRVLGPAKATALLRRRCADESLAVRTRAVEALAELGTAEGVRLLVERLEVEREVRLGWRIVATLQRLTGRKYRRDPRPWRLFADGLPADWAPAPEGTSGELGEDRSRAFAGLSILSARVAFLIDLSGSIWKERADGKTRKQVIDGELRAALESLPPETLFNVIPFTATPHPWKESLVPATKANVRRAIRDFERCREQGTGNVFDAILLALDDPAVDTVVILTDGAPTGGRRHRLELMIPLLAQHDATRMVAMDSILVDSTRRLRLHWADLAARTGGRSLAVDL